ncbi:MAG: nicotinate-nucleotide adenylyltransferase [Pyrinomonadaceae bacterium]
MQRRIAVYGGSFDPVHKGHLAIARKLIELFRLDEFLMMPAHVAPHKRRFGVTPALHRHAMLALATQADERVFVSTLELESPDMPYTVETLSRLCNEAGAEEENARVMFVMGADSWAEITTWREWERVLTMVDHIVVTRPGSPLELDHVTTEIRSRVSDLRGADAATIQRIVEQQQQQPSTHRIYFTDAVHMEVSSTSARDAARSGVRENLRLTVPASVADYIDKYKLYKAKREQRVTDVERARSH